MADVTTSDVVSLHPQASTRFQQKIAEIHEPLSRGDSASAEAVSLVRDLIKEIRVIPRGKKEPVDLEIVGDRATLMTLESYANTVTASVVAGLDLTES